MDRFDTTTTALLLVPRLIYGARGIVLGIIRLFDEKEFIKRVFCWKKKANRVSKESLKRKQYVDNEDVAFLSSSLNNIVVSNILKGITISLKNCRVIIDESNLELLKRQKETQSFDEIDLIEPKQFEEILNTVSARKDS